MPAHSLAVLQKLVTFLSDLWGADKVYRAIAYGARAFAFFYRLVRQRDDAAVRAVAAAGKAVSQARYVIRFWGVLDSAYELADVGHAVAGGSASLRDRSTLLRTLQAVTMLIYHPLEHAYWLEGVAPGTLPAGLGDRLSQASCVAWLLWCLLALYDIRCSLQVVQAKLIAGPSAPAEGEVEATTTVERLEAMTDARRRLRLRGSVYVADTLLALHWSLSQGIGLNDGVIGLLGLYGAGVGAYLKWTAMSC